MVWSWQYNAELSLADASFKGSFFLGSYLLYEYYTTLLIWFFFSSFFFNFKILYVFFSLQKRGSGAFINVLYRKNHNTFVCTWSLFSLLMANFAFKPSRMVWFHVTELNIVFPLFYRQCSALHCIAMASLWSYHHCWVRKSGALFIEIFISDHLLVKFNVAQPSIWVS